MRAGITRLVEPKPQGSETWFICRNSRRVYHFTTTKMSTTSTPTTTALCQTLTELNEAMYHDDTIEVAINTLEKQEELVNNLKEQVAEAQAETQRAMEYDNAQYEAGLQVKTTIIDGLRAIPEFHDKIQLNPNPYYFCAHDIIRSVGYAFSRYTSQLKELQEENNRLHKYNEHLIKERATFKGDVYRIYDERKQTMAELKTLQEKIKEEEPKIEVIKRKSDMYDDLVIKYEKKFGKTIKKKF